MIIVQASNERQLSKKSLALMSSLNKNVDFVYLIFFNIDTSCIVGPGLVGFGVFEPVPIFKTFFVAKPCKIHEENSDFRYFFGQ